MSKMNPWTFQSAFRIALRSSVILFSIHQLHLELSFTKLRCRELLRFGQLPLRQQFRRLLQDSLLHFALRHLLPDRWFCLLDLANRTGGQLTHLHPRCRCCRVRSLSQPGPQPQPS